MSENGLNEDVQKLLDYFAELPERAIAQGSAEFSAERGNPACVAAHTAFVLRKREAKWYRYQSGANKLRVLFSDVGYTGGVAKLLKKHGAADTGPFGGKKWKERSYVVLRGCFP